MKYKTLFPVVLMTVVCSPVLFNRSTGKAINSQKISRLNAFSPKEGSQTINVLNLEDYIYIQEDEKDLPDLVVQFEEYAKENGYPNAKVIYNTTDTNETMYGEMQTGKASYDVICTSDYMIQKLMNENLLYELSNDDKNQIPHYFGEHSNASKRITETFSSIKGNDDKLVGDYAVGYMWGTLGIVFNPQYKAFEKRNISEDEVIQDMSSWSSLWDKKYKNTFSIKDSMRDTYAIGVMETYKDELKKAQDLYFANRDTDEDGALTTYQETISDIFNRSDKKYVDEIMPSLESLKKNSFGLEVDSGKEDIVTGKIGMNIAWSGDACYSISQASDEELVSNPFDLYYAVPDLGSNIWFDGWAIPKNTKRSPAQLELALMWLDFISQPANVSQNVDYTGYTPFCGGDEVLEITRDYYDIRTSYIMTENEEAVYYIDSETKEEVELSYDDFFVPRTNNEALFYKEDNEVHEFLDPMNEDDVPLHYNDLIEVLKDVEEVDLSYFFDGTLKEYEESDMTFYSDCYLPFSYLDDNGVEKQNTAVGGKFFCAFPSLETINRCAVMRDYGKNNKIIMKMWEDFKSDPLPVWAIVLFSVEIAGIVGGASVYIVKKQMKLRIRHKRKEQK